jgi:hypothetical protein
MRRGVRTLASEGNGGLVRGGAAGVLGLAEFFPLQEIADGRRGWRRLQLAWWSDGL